MRYPETLSREPRGNKLRGPVKQYANPVYGRDFPDPFVLPYRGRFYAYATEAPGYGFQVMESPDLVHWTHRGTALKPPWSQRHLWAPEVAVHEERFFMTYSALNGRTGKHDIAIAVADRPLGPFEHQAVLVRAEDNRVGVIDATIFLDTDRTPYLVYSEEDPRRIVMRRMAPNLLSVEDRKVELVRPDRDRECGVTEAPTLIHRGGLYHLFFSVGCYEGTKRHSPYAVAHAVSTALDGPYVKSSRLLLETAPGRAYGPGHQCLVVLPDGETWMVYHAWNAQGEPRYGSNPIGRTMRIDRLTWRGSLPMVDDGPSVTPREAPYLGK